MHRNIQELKETKLRERKIPLWMFLAQSARLCKREIQAHVLCRYFPIITHSALVFRQDQTGRRRRVFPFVYRFMKTLFEGIIFRDFIAISRKKKLWMNKFSCENTAKEKNVFSSEIELISEAERLFRWKSWLLFAYGSVF